MTNDTGHVSAQSGGQVPPPRKRSSSSIMRWLFGCGGGALLFIIGGALTIRYLIDDPQVTGYLDILPHDKQVYGDRLAWRTLVELPDRLGFMGAITAGNFDNDPEQEILLVSCPAQFHLINLDGSRVKLADAPFDYAHWIKAWDFDADGVDEIILDGTDLNSHQDVVVYGMDGKQKHRFKNQRMGAHSITGDYDGDGHDDLMLIEAIGPAAWIYTTNGQVLEQLDVIQRSSPLMLADIDQDGLAEAIIYEFENFSVYDYGLESRIEQWPKIKYDSQPNWAFDLTGDGIPELINPVKGVLDITATIIPLQYDNVLELDFLSSPGTISCCVFREVPNGPASLVVVPGNFNVGPIYIFDSSGTMTYHQKINPKPTDCLVISSQGQDYLVVSTEQNIMIYP